MNEELKKGDTVRLKSGGPLMTVVDTNVGRDNKVECTWFDDNKGVQKAFFPPETLKSDAGGMSFA